MEGKDKKDIFDEMDDVLGDLDTLCPGAGNNDVITENDESFDDDVPTEAPVVRVTPDGWPKLEVSGSSAHFVAVVTDDSGSVRDRGSESQLVDAIRLMVFELKNIKGETKKEIFIAIQGFKELYYIGDVSKLDENKLRIRCDHLCTPLVETSIVVLQNVCIAEDELKKRGISTGVSVLILTDGVPYRDTGDPDHLKRVISDRYWWRISGLGLDNVNPSEEEIDFVTVFADMGIKKVVKSTPEELRAALYSFSRSVSAV